MIAIRSGKKQIGKTLPMQVSGLYVTLPSRCTLDDPENEELARTALKLLVVSHRPLSMLELAWAVALGTTGDLTTVHALVQVVDHQRIMSLIYPFIARVDYEDLQRHQVRFVHQSVKEFAIEEWASHQPHAAHLDSTGSDEVIPGQNLQYLEAFILNTCIRYLLLEDIAHCDLFSEEQAAIAQLPQGYDFFDENKEPVDYNPHCTWDVWEQDTTCFIHYDPADRGFGEFFVYASCYWLEHLANVPTNSVPSLLARIEGLCQAGSTRLHNWTQQNCRPGCTMTRETRPWFESSRTYRHRGTDTNPPKYYYYKVAPIGAPALSMRNTIPCAWLCGSVTLRCVISWSALATLIRAQP